MTYSYMKINDIPNLTDINLFTPVKKINNKTQINVSRVSGKINLFLSPCRWCVCNYLAFIQMMFDSMAKFFLPLVTPHLCVKLFPQFTNTLLYLKNLWFITVNYLVNNFCLKNWVKKNSGVRAEELASLIHLLSIHPYHSALESANRYVF